MPEARKLGARSDKQNFLHGALNLSIAAAVVKVIGALYKIPIQRVLSEAGAAHFANAYNVYAAIFVLATAGLPVAVSKMISEAEAGGTGESARIFEVARKLFFGIGLFFSLAMLIGAQWIAGWMSDPLAVWAIRAIAPSVFLIGLISPYRGYYQGKRNMTPTAVSQVIEATGKLIFGVGLAYFVLAKLLPLDDTLSRQLARDEMGAAAAVFGVTLGLCLSAIYMAVRSREERRLQAPKTQGRGRRGIAREMIAMAIPITLSSGIMSVTILIDTGLVRSCLAWAGFGEAQINLTTGSYSYAWTLYNLPQAFILTLAVSLLPAIAAARVRGDMQGARRTIRIALRVTGMIALPMAAGLSCLARPILTLLYGEREGVTIATPLLQVLGVATVFVCIVTVTNAVLQSLGMIHLPIITMSLGCGVKIACTLALVPREDVNILGAAIGTTLCFALIAVLNIALIIRLTGQGGKLLGVLGKPLVAAAGMAAITPGFYLATDYFLGSTLKLGHSGSFSTILAVGAGMLSYAILLILLKGLPKEDIELLPGGKKIVTILRIS